jgi:hypothetical protein
VGSWMTTTWSSLVNFTSNSIAGAPCSTASLNDARVFSGAYLHAPRCPIMTGVDNDLNISGEIDKIRLGSPLEKINCHRGLDAQVPGDIHDLAAKL